VIRLVIVDDNSMVLDGLRALFGTAADFSVVGEGTNGLEGIIAAREAGADVVLMDVSMPQMDGIEACRRLSVECPTTRVILYSALWGRERMAAAVTAGAADYLGKDLPPDDLVARVRSIALGEGAAPAITPAERVAHVGVRPAVDVPPRRHGHTQPEVDPTATPRENEGPTAEGPEEDAPTVGVLAPFLAGAYLTELMLGIAAAAEAAGVRLIAIQTVDPGGLWSSEHPIPEVVTTRMPSRDLRISWDRIDGFLIVLDAVEPWFLDTIREAGKPAVAVSDDTAGFQGPTVQADNRTGILQAMAHLFEHGHRRIAFAGCQAQSDIRERLQAYREALSACGIEPDDSLVFDTGDNRQSGGHVAARGMLAAGMPSTAVVAATDSNAIGIIKVLSDAGLRLPRDQAIVGFDGIPAGLSTRPTLSSVHQGIEEIGRTAIDLLTQAMRGRTVAPGRHLVPTVFVPRESCGCSLASTVTAFAGDDILNAAGPEQRFRGRLEKLLVTSPGRLSVAQRQSLDRAAEVILRLARERPPAPWADDAEFTEASLALLDVSPHWTTIRWVEACLQAYWDEISSDVGGDGKALEFEGFLRELAMELARLLLEIEDKARTELRTTLDAEHDLSASVIRGGVDRPSSLDWLSLTPARAGCLGLWSDGYSSQARSSPRLRIAGSFLRDGGRLALPEEVAIEAFPPEALISERRPGEIVAVVALKTTSMDLGFLANVMPVSSTEVGGRDRLFDIGVLLAMSLQREITAESLRLSLEDLSTYSNVMAHDLRNPLATILMWTSVAPSTVGPDDRAEPVLQMFHRIREVAVYANGLITNLLRYAELDRHPNPTEPVDLDVVVSRAVAGLEAAIAESGAVIRRGALPTVVADPAGLEMVMENLISNAITHRRDVLPQVVIEAAAAGDTWEIRCRDNGTGIPADLGDAVFQPFVRGDASISGSGLGLATCRRIIERLGGRMWVDESSETGTCIAFTLLRVAPGSATAPAHRRGTAR
jgi:DNA-binding LacI/PurR family transcriptional regulator/signal transduction histidine kinase/DNA-binding NarL/FixJ family response regulator